jgi:hypothetical protein
MKHLSNIVVLGVVLAASLCGAQDAAPAAVGHGAFPVKIEKTLDSSKLKEGDAVEVETAGSFKLADGTLVPKGSKMTGHVVMAKSRSKGDTDSQLTLAFDKLSLPAGKQLSVKGMVQAVFPPEEGSPAPMMAGKATGAGGGGFGASANVGTVTSDKSGSNMQSNGQPQPETDPKSAGVQGMHDLQLDSGVLSSKGKQVKLGTGVRMIVHVDILG